MRNLRMSLKLIFMKMAAIWTPWDTIWSWEHQNSWTRQYNDYKNVGLKIYPWDAWRPYLPTRLKQEFNLLADLLEQKHYSSKANSGTLSQDEGAVKSFCCWGGGGGGARERGGGAWEYIGKRFLFFGFQNMNTNSWTCLSPDDLLWNILMYVHVCICMYVIMYMYVCVCVFKYDWACVCVCLWCNKS